MAYFHFFEEMLVTTKTKTVKNRKKQLFQYVEILDSNLLQLHKKCGDFLLEKRHSKNGKCKKQLPKKQRGIF